MSTPLLCPRGYSKLQVLPLNLDLVKGLRKARMKAGNSFNLVGGLVRAPITGEKASTNGPRKWVTFTVAREAYYKPKTGESVSSYFSVYSFDSLVVSKIEGLMKKGLLVPGFNLSVGGELTNRTRKLKVKGKEVNRTEIVLYATSLEPIFNVNVK